MLVFVEGQKILLHTKKNIFWTKKKYFSLFILLLRDPLSEAGQFGVKNKRCSTSFN